MTIGSITSQGAGQYMNKPIQTPQITSSSLQGAPSQNSTANKENRVPGDPGAQSLVTRQRLQDLVREVDPTLQLDEEVEDMLLQMADDFIDTTSNAAIALAKHRKAPAVELRDVQIHLERHWNMWIPGFGNDEIRPYKRAAVSEAHKQRMALIRKTIKKY